MRDIDSAADGLHGLGVTAELDVERCVEMEHDRVLLLDLVVEFELFEAVAAPPPHPVQFFNFFNFSS